MYSFPNVKMHLAQGLKHSDGKSCLHSSLRLVFPEHHARAEVGDASRAVPGWGRQRRRGPRWLLSAPARNSLGSQVATALLTWSFD